MPVFVYESRDATGEKVSGKVEASNRKAATQRLQEQRMAIISLKEVSSGVRAGDVDALLDKFKRVNEQALTVFSRQFATMINAGLAMVRCLDILSEQTAQHLDQLLHPEAEPVG